MSDDLSRDVVMLDIDGTLVDSTYLHARAWARAFARHGHVVPDWRIHRAIGLGGDKLVPELLGEDAERDHGDEVRDAWGEEYAALADEAHPLPGAAELVRTLHDQGWLVAAASSGEERFATPALESLGVSDLLDVVVTNAEVEQSKPSPDLLGVTLEQVGADRGVMVGDSIYDIEAASRIGLACVAVRTGGFGRAELEAAGAAYVIDDLTSAGEVDWAALMRAPDQRER